MEDNQITEQPAIPTKDQIKAFQDALIPIRCEMPQAEHFFAPGMYGRKFAMPAGMVVVGKIHKHSHLMMVLKGKAEVVTEFGRDIVEAGYVTVSQPGAKRIVLAYEDTVFMTVHYNPDDIEDLEEIEKQHIEDEGFKLEYHQAAKGKLT